MDKFEEWIEEQIVYYETEGDNFIYLSEEIITAFYDCLNEYRRLKEKGEI